MRRGYMRLLSYWGRVRWRDRCGSRRRRLLFLVLGGAWDGRTSVQPGGYALSIERVTVLKTTCEYTANAIEPLFGIGRILYSLLEHAYWCRPQVPARGVSHQNPPSLPPSQTPSPALPPILFPILFPIFSPIPSPILSPPYQPTPGPFPHHVRHPNKTPHSPPFNQKKTSSPPLRGSSPGFASSRSRTQSTPRRHQSGSSTPGMTSWGHRWGSRRTLIR